MTCLGCPELTGSLFSARSNCFVDFLLQETSKLRHQYLSSLYKYMQGCNKELNFLAEEQDKIKKQDWSDHMVDLPDVRWQYEVRTDVTMCFYTSAV
ncbi:hypothetical protein GOODEAATRI_023142 [Goodea atripinnis]|uniref:Uncharacterized protein n=1 Tax=Goodea atripinnis TaxID=208336 RepID=A0ABV0Q0H2_9TELE